MYECLHTQLVTGPTKFAKPDVLWWKILWPRTYYSLPNLKIAHSIAVFDPDVTKKTTVIKTLQVTELFRTLLLCPATIQQDRVHCGIVHKMSLLQWNVSSGSYLLQSSATRAWDIRVPTSTTVVQSLIKQLLRQLKMPNVATPNVSCIKFSITVVRFCKTT